MIDLRKTYAKLAGEYLNKVFWKSNEDIFLTQLETEADMNTVTKPKTRIYAVTRRHVTEGATRLVRATTPAAALAFVAHDELDSELATQDDIYAAGKAGIEVEEPVDTATAPPKPAEVQVDIEDDTPATMPAAESL